jgi:hypothetical protein
MTQDLVAQARAATPFNVTPLGEKIVVFPVALTQEASSIFNVELKDQLPDMGVVVGVGFEVNYEWIKELRHLRQLLDGNSWNEAEEAETKMLVQLLEEEQLIGVGDVLALNRFSGMAIPGTQLMAYERADLISKQNGAPVELKTEQERWDARTEEKKFDDAGIDQVRRIVPAGG